MPFLQSTFAHLIEQSQHPLISEYLKLILWSAKILKATEQIFILIKIALRKVNITMKRIKT